MIECMDISRQNMLHKKEFMYAIEKVFDDCAFSGGKYVEQFERDFSKYIGVEYFSAVGNGTDALFLAMKALGLGEGDEFLVPADTFIASAWGGLHCGATPIFCDIDPETWEIDVEDAKRRITPQTKAIVAVHLYGQPADMDSVCRLANENRLYVVEDCAQAQGARYKGKRVGCLGDISCFSFYPGKNLGAFGEAGGVGTNNRELYDKVELLKNHGCKTRYHHEVIGYNMRMDGIHGSVLSTKLNMLDDWNERRREIGKRYCREFKNARIKVQFQPEDTMTIYHLFEIEVDDRDLFMKHMENNGIHCAMHYPVACHKQKVFDGTEIGKVVLPIAEYHAAHCVSLPIFPEMTDEETSLVIKAVNSYTGN